MSEVARLLAEHGVRAEQLTLEVTQPPPGVSPGVTETLTGLGRLGCRVSVSELCTGSSSLRALSRYEGSGELKLDSGLVADLLAHRTAERLARAIIGTEPAPDIRVVAEGVESHEMVTHLRDRGCYVLQGYHKRPPPVLEEVRHWAMPGRCNETASSAWRRTALTRVLPGDGAHPEENATYPVPGSSSR